MKPKEIKKIFKKFAGLDKSKKGYVTVDDLSKIPEIEKNPLRFYICQYLTKNSAHEDEINFELFLKTLDIFKNGKTNEQYRCIMKFILVIYDLFDFNNDGKVCFEDLLINLKLLIGHSLTEDQLSEIVDKTIQEFSSDQKCLTFDEFVKLLEM